HAYQATIKHSTGGLIVSSVGLVIHFGAVLGDQRVGPVFEAVILLVCASVHQLTVSEEVSLDHLDRVTYLAQAGSLLFGLRLGIKRTFHYRLSTLLDHPPVLVNAGFPDLKLGVAGLEVSDRGELVRAFAVLAVAVLVRRLVAVAAL